MSSFQSIGKMLILLGSILLIVGGLCFAVSKLPILEKIPLNLRWQWGSVKIYFPLGICLLLSIIFTLFFQVWGRK